MALYPDADSLVQKKGQVIGRSSWLRLDQSMIDSFAEATGDRQWIHIDPERCRRELGGTTIAHGYLVLSLIARFSYEAYQVGGVKRAINYGSDKIRYVAPVPPGSRLRGIFRLLEARRGEDRLRVKNEVTVEMQDSERPVLVAQVISLLYL